MHIYSRVQLLRECLLSAAFEPTGHYIEWHRMLRRWYASRCGARAREDADKQNSQGVGGYIFLANVGGGTTLSV